MAATTAIISAVSTTADAVAGNKAAKANNKAQRRSAAIERASAQIENVRRARRAVAARRLQEAELIQAGATEGLRSSSGISGAVGSLRTQTASNIGAANTQLGAQVGISRTLQRGATLAARYGTLSNTFGAIGQASQAIGSSPEAQTFLKNQFNNVFSRNS